MELIRLKNLWFSYEDTYILKDVNITINPGEFVCLTGANGCGKSTLLKLMLNLLTPKQGEMLFEGIPLAKSKQDKKISYVSQKATGFNQNFPATVEETVRLGLYGTKLGKNKREAKTAVERALRLVGMEDKAKSLLGKLSGGQQQRVFIAKALVNEPKLVFLDEPTTGIDSGMADSICCSLGELNKKLGLTVLMVTHDLNSIHNHATKILKFNKSGTIETTEALPK